MNISSIVRQYEAEARERINLVASENVMSDNARRMLSGDLVHRYLIPPEGERHPAIWDYPNQDLPRLLYHHCQKLAARIFKGAYADLRPLSGNSAAFVVITSCSPKRTSVLSVPAECGGHFATAVICAEHETKRLDIPYESKAATVDLVRFRELIQISKPSLIFLDASMVLFPYPLQEMREIVGDDVIIAYDASHTYGLIGGGVFQSPLEEGADLITGSVHKSLFGPQKGMIVAREGPDVEMVARVRETIVPLFVSNAHLHHIAALGVALEELEAFGSQYANQVVSNANLLARYLDESRCTRVFAVNGVYTKTHQVWCMVGEKKAAINTMLDLDRIGIGVNAIRIPFISQYGIRLGLSEVTRRGFCEEAIHSLGNIISDSMKGLDEPSHLRARVRDLASQFPCLSYVSPVV